MEIKEVLRQWQAGFSQRAIARATGLSRTTVHKYILAAEQAGLHQGGSAPTEEQLTGLAPLNLAGPRQVAVPTEATLGPWADQIHTWLTGDRLLLTRIQELLAQRGCMISYTSLRRFVSRHGWRRKRQRTVRMADTRPGEVAELDFGRLGLVWDPNTGRRRVAWALVIVLAYSRHCFVWPLFQQQLPDVIQGLEAAWAFFQGMPRYLVLDNFPAAIAAADPLHPKLTRGFLEYAQHRGFLPDPTRVRHPKDKPHVERGIPYVRERFFKGGQFLGLADLRAQAQHWCLAVAGQRVHGTTRQLPLLVFQEEEQQTLLPWDGEPYDGPDWRSALVHPDHHIACQYALYSVPATLCPPGTKVELRLDSKLVRIYHRGKLVKVHPRQSRGGRSTDQEDYPAELSPYTLRAPEQLKSQAAALGPWVAAFAQRLLEGPLPWAKLRQGQKLLRLGERYTAQRLEDACQKALGVDLIDVRRLERILIEALAAEAAPLMEPSAVPLPGRFARPGSVFAHTKRQAAPPHQTLTPLLKRLKLGAILNTLPERLPLARREHLDYAAFLQIILADEVTRREQRRLEIHLQKAGFEEVCRLEDFDWSTPITLDRRLLDAVFSLGFLTRQEHVLLLGPVGVGKSFLAQALGYAAVRAGYTVRFVRADHFFKALAQARVDHSLERTFRSFLIPDLLILDDLGLHKLSAQQSSDLYELIISRHRRSSLVITSNRAVEEWLGLFDDPILGNSALDRLANASYQVVIEGSSYRERLSPHRREVVLTL